MVVMDDNGIVRTKGRVNAVGYTMDAIILPPESRVTFLLVRFYHEKYHYLAHETEWYKIQILYSAPKSTAQIRKKSQLCKKSFTNFVGHQEKFIPIMVLISRPRRRRYERSWSRSTSIKLQSSSTALNGNLTLQEPLTWAVLGKD